MPRLSFLLFAALLLASCSAVDAFIDSADDEYEFKSCWSSGGEKYQYGDWVYGGFEPTPVGQPFFPYLHSLEAMEYAGYGGEGRMIKRLVEKRCIDDISQVTVKITLLDSLFHKYSDIIPAYLVFYRTGEENGKYVFETLKLHPLDYGYNPEKHGRIILFSKDPADQGVHGNFLVIHVKSAKDNFRYEVVKW